MYKNSNSLDFSDFTKTVLEWNFETLSKPLAIALSQMPLPKAAGNINQYYQNFLPFILEEARAIIADGLERVHQHTQRQSKRNSQQKNTLLNDVQAFDLRLKKQANLPKREGNPMFLHLSGVIPSNIEHGSSMNVLLLKTREISPAKEWIALVTEDLGTSELFAKIIIDPIDYDEYQRCFAEKSKWKAHYLGSIISEQRMYDACLEAINSISVEQIARANIPMPCTKHVLTSCNLDHLNLSQREAIYAFLNAKQGSTLLLQGPPGTGKTTTLVELLKEVTGQGKRTMVSAHSNKGVQVLALRSIDEMPNVPMILVGVANKLPEALRSIFLHDWYDMILSSFYAFHEAIESLLKGAQIPPSTNSLMVNIERDIRMAEKALNQFALIDARQLSYEKKQSLYALTQDPLLVSDFMGFYQHLVLLKQQPQSKRLWQALLTALNRFIGKWQTVKKEALEAYLLDGASIIFSTLISAGRKSMLTMAPIDYLLVDEAAQSVEAATLIPMRFQPSKTLLVGDTKQLPATVISPVLDDAVRRYSTHYQWSMMWRLIEENKQPSLMLNIQYRMHPSICQWPSQQYYANWLMTAPQLLPMSTLDEVDITSRPYAIYHISGQAESREGSNSPYNAEEAVFVVKIIEHIRRKNQLSAIGVITPYAEQKRLISEKLSLKKTLQKFVDVNTVDGFQGDERDIIIISFTRTHVSEFLKEFRRLNVAITRAKFCLIILASPNLLSNDIGQLIADAKLRQVLYSEAELHQILQIGAIPAAPSVLETTDLWKMAWQGKPDAQLQYAKTLLDKPEAFVWYRRSAENNQAEAQYTIGQVYLSGHDGIKKDIQLGVAWLNKASQQHFPRAQYLLGQYCVLGHVVVKNVKLGITLCESAVSSNLLDAMVFLARLYDEGKEIPRQAKVAEKYYRLAAKQEHIISIESLAGLLSLGTLENQREALKWYQKIAARKITTAYYPLAHLLHTVFDRQIEANYWYLKAAEEGNHDAQYELGLRFKNGAHGCAINIERSNDFFQEAAYGGHMESQFMYASILKAQGKVLESRRFFQLAANEGHVGSQYEFALSIATQDKHMAYSYYCKAAKQGHLLAQERCIPYQIQFNRDLPVCLNFCERLTAEGNVEIQFLLARIFDTGLVGAIDQRRAYGYYLPLAQSGHALAQYHCAVLLEKGLGVDSDCVAARQYYESSIEHCLRARLRLACLLLRKIEAECQEARMLGSEQNPANAKAHQQDGPATGLYQRPVALLEHYLKHHQEKSLVKTTEQYLEDLILNNRAKDAAFEIGVVNTRSAEANYLLGRIFQEGVGVVKDVKRALQHYQLASDFHADASYRAGYLYELGCGVLKNSSCANAYYRSAANQGHELATKRLTWAYWLFTKEDNIPDDETLRKTESSNCVMM